MHDISSIFLNMELGPAPVKQKVPSFDLHEGLAALEYLKRKLSHGGLSEFLPNIEQNLPRLAGASQSQVMIKGIKDAFYATLPEKGSLKLSVDYLQEVDGAGYTHKRKDSAFEIKIKNNSINQTLVHAVVYYPKSFKGETEQRINYKFISMDGEIPMSTDELEYIMDPVGPQDEIRQQLKVRRSDDVNWIEEMMQPRMQQYGAPIHVPYCTGAAILYNLIFVASKVMLTNTDRVKYDATLNSGKSDYQTFSSTLVKQIDQYGLM